MFSAVAAEGKIGQSGRTDKETRVEGACDEEKGNHISIAADPTAKVTEGTKEESTDQSTLPPSSSSSDLPTQISAVKSDSSLTVMKTDECLEKANDEIDSSTSTKLSTNPLSGSMHDLPDLNDDKLGNKFELDVSSVDVTCIDIACHGCHVFVGCSTGMVMLFNMASNSQKGIVIGQIKAKGLHTNLLLTVKIADDARFAFAGVMKGSMEMLAIDMSKVPVWPEKNRRSNALLKDLVNVHSHSDPKLRGLGAVVRAVDNSSDAFQYRLVCGKGIKNVHVWSFFPDCVDGPRWTCLYDVASNGNTIETMAFRRGGNEILSKSSHMGVRLWRINDEDTNKSTAAATGKLAFEDVPNTQDARIMLEDYVLGGTYNFAVIKIGASKALNRNEFEVPERTTEDDNGQRRKRQMRLIEDVISTQDGRQALALCSDGGVLYFRNDYIELDELGNEENAHTSSSSSGCSLIEFNSLQRNSTEGPWALRRVGKRGAVVLLRSETMESEDGHKTIISVNLLSVAADTEVSDTKLPLGAKSWSVCGYYHEKDTNAETEEASATTNSKSINKKKSPKLATPASAIISARSSSNNRNKSISPADNLMQIVDSSIGTPIQKEASERSRINNAKSRTDGCMENRKRKAPSNNVTTSVDIIKQYQTQSSTPTWKFVEKPEKPLETKHLMMPPIKRIPFMKESFDVVHVDQQKNKPEKDHFKKAKEKFMAEWLDSIDSRPLVVDNLGEWAVNSRCISTIQQVMMEQDRILRQFIDDIVRSLESCVANYSKYRCLDSFIQEARIKQKNVLKDFGDGVSSCIQIRQLEFASAVASDRMKSTEENIRNLILEMGKQSGVVEVQSIEDFVLGPNIVFKYRDVFDAARNFLSQTVEVISMNCR